MNPELIRFALLAMDAYRFEDLVYALVQIDEPTARQLKPPDAGRDTIVPAAGGQSERVWQAKHHTDAINWKKCRESLEQALSKRDPGEVTFVFPINMTEGKEQGLIDLRADFQQVTIPEPWTLGTLREKLIRHPEIRRAHIDAVVGFDHDFAREMLERGARLREGWDEQTAAALEGPLAVRGQESEIRAAQTALDERRFDDASVCFEQVADAIAARAPGVADALLMQAARAAAEHGERDRAGELHLRVSRSAAARGDDVAEYAAFRASWEVSDSNGWRSFAAIARAAWPERPEQTIPVLRDALDRSLDAADLNAITEWSDALCAALAAEDDWPAVREAAARAVAALGPVTPDGQRLDLELELLTARAELGEDVDDDFRTLLLSSVGHNDPAAARVNARWGMILARRGGGLDAATRFRDAAQRWRAAADSEDEIAEAIFSEDAVAQLLGSGRRLDQTQRIAVAELRGRGQTPAVLADRKEYEALRTWLTGRAYDARRALTIAWSTHRRAGHFSGWMRIALALAELFAAAEEWSPALSWAIRAGRTDLARTAAGELTPTEAQRHVRAGRPAWERAPMWEAVAVTGLSASDEQAASLTDELLQAAANHDTFGLQLAPEASAARRALSSLLCAIPERHRTQALAEVAFEVRNSGFPPDQAVHGLLYAMNAGLCDEAELITDVFSVFGRSHVGGFDIATRCIAESTPARDRLAENTASDFTALLTAAWCQLPDDHPALAQRAADVTQRALADALDANEIMNLNDRGQLARWAPAADQRRLLPELIATLADPSDLDLHRHEAGEGIAVLAARLDPADAASALSDLLEAADQIETPSELQSLRSHRNPRFARRSLNAPVTPGAVDAIALRAGVELAARCDRLDEMQQLTENATRSAHPRLRAEALRLGALRPTVASPDVRSFLTDEDESVQAQALTGLATTGALTDDDPAVTEFADPQRPITLRAAALSVAREHPDRFAAALEILVSDPFAPLRASAQAQSGSPGTTSTNASDTS
ncbi:MAG: hypothetical protein ACR2QA_19175 [Solirubrobacteraceae bacterium]